MNLIVRKPNLESLTEEAIPKDFSDVMNYFNEGLKNNSYPWIPRKKPISSDEIRNLWLPSLNRNICYVAELNGRIIGCATILYDKNSSAYEHSDVRKSGELSATIDPYEDSIFTLAELNRALVKELVQSDRKAFAYISANSPAINAMELIGYKPKGKVARKEFQGDVFEFELP
jgi:L-amino acid N-acyltransferase YncA